MESIIIMCVQELELYMDSIIIMCVQNSMYFIWRACVQNSVDFI